MKKVFVNFKSLGFVALAAAVLTFSSCTKETTPEPEPEPEPTVKCTESRDDNFESTTDSCNSAGTVAKFIGNWKATLSGVTPVETYDIKVSVATSADYTVTIETNYGVSAPAAKAARGGADKAFIAPITMNYDVAKDKATHAAEFTATPSSSKIKDVVFTVTGSTATFTYNLDGASYTDTVEKL